jgi:hypothetical protein
MNSRETEELVKMLTSDYERGYALQKLKDSGWSPSTGKERAYCLFASYRLEQIFDKDENAEQILTEILSDKDESGALRMNAADVLGKAKIRSAVNPLISLIDSEDTGLHNHAIIALGKISDPRAIDPLIEVLRLNDDDLRSGISIYAARSLTMMGGEKAFNALKEAMKGTYSFSMQSALSLCIAALEIEEYIKKLENISDNDFERFKKDSLSVTGFDTGHDVKMCLMDTFESYFRILELDLRPHEVKIAIDNQVEKSGQVAPATRVLKLFIIKYGSRYYRFAY